MSWVPCVRLDLPDDAGLHEARWLAAAAEPILAAVRQNSVAHLNVAVSAAALAAFERHGCEELLAELVALAARRKIELCATAAHGALLPLLPPAEALRQLELNDRSGERLFGVLYRPGCLWPPALAVSRRLLEAASRLGYEAVLVDERAMRAPAGWPGDRIDQAEGFPGLFLLPVSRALNEEVATGHARTRDALAPPRPGRPRYRVLAVDITPRLAPPRALLELLARDPTFRAQDVLKHFPLDGTSSPLPSSALSTDAQLAGGQPFAPWFRPGDRRQERRWRLATRLAQAVESLGERALWALPEVRQLRAALDRAWRESRWREEDDGDLLSLRPLLTRLAPLLPAALAPELDELFDAFAPAWRPPGAELEAHPPP